MDIRIYKVFTSLLRLQITKLVQYFGFFFSVVTKNHKKPHCFKISADSDFFLVQTSYSYIFFIHSLQQTESEVILVCKETEYMVCVLRQQEKGGPGKYKQI